MNVIELGRKIDGNDVYGRETSFTCTERTSLAAVVGSAKALNGSVLTGSEISKSIDRIGSPTLNIK
ncbi:hypothetical protein F442_16457 [Phytophthora nicotianae P10297]|uniref:Uncharacterized protein n=2 Tax=Phytophthora nicotianae TaxID=4792 RepID=W2PQG7_PHYN3|nr:hypothetical protein PPTG_23854 [Phytophthora nicotianae INRA-310]ETN02871.1 hypothetical protein PPTG_23854 [Phytophthora nicotianae INRA-310]ETP35319.1 hypothetical protein F442_16457 [Phytophthora nicotianae P10297]